jgi:hypothetical protein
MRRDGKKLEEGSRDDLFSYYCRLFSIASLSALAAPAVRLLRRLPVLRRHPSWIHMGFLEFGFRIVNAIHRRTAASRKPHPSPVAPPSETTSPDLVRIQ